MMKVVAVIGYSGVGKTTLIEHVIRNFKNRGIRVSCVKHSHHEVNSDLPGKDTWRMQQSGCFEVALVSDRYLSVQRRFEQIFEMSVHQVLANLYEGVDWVFVEGFKSSDILKIEVVNGKHPGQDLICASDDFVAALICSPPLAANIDSNLPKLPLDQPDDVADWLITHQDRFVYSVPLP